MLRLLGLVSKIFAHSDPNTSPIWPQHLRWLSIGGFSDRRKLVLISWRDWRLEFSVYLVEGHTAYESIGMAQILDKLKQYYRKFVLSANP
jgi:hypothetical protein